MAIKFTKWPKIYQMDINYTKWPWNIPNGHKIHRRLLLPDPPRFTQIWVFCLKLTHLATLTKSIGKVLANRWQRRMRK
jgi:hypothetical protein